MINAVYNQEQIEQARAAGLDVIEPGPDEIFVDLDSQQDQYVMEALLPLFSQNGLAIEVVKVSRSRNGNKHAYLKAGRSLTDLERVALQAILGSDRKREAMGFLRILNGIAPVTLFFEKPAVTVQAEAF